MCVVGYSFEYRLKVNKAGEKLATNHTN